MKRPVRNVVAGLALAGLVGVGSPIQAAAQDASPMVAYRQSLMNSFRTHMAGVRAAVGGEVPAGHAQHHAIAFSHMAQALANVFPEGSAGPGSRALPAIWQNRADFMNKVSAIQSATASLVTASQSGDTAAMQSALQAVQGACAGCHQPYRGPAN